MAKKLGDRELLNIYNETLKKRLDYKSDSYLEFNKIDNKGRPKAHRTFSPTREETRILSTVIRDVRQSLGLITPPSLLLKEYIHFDHCINCMNSTLKILDTIQAELETNPLRGAAYRFAIVSYCIPYTDSKTEKDTQNNGDPFRLPDTHIPSDRLDLHKKIMKERHTLHAHEQLVDLDAVLHIHEDGEKKYPLIPQNKMDYTKGFKDIPKIIELINGTLDNMLVHKEVLFNALPNPSA